MTMRPLLKQQVSSCYDRKRFRKALLALIFRALQGGTSTTVLARLFASANFFVLSTDASRCRLTETNQTSLRYFLRGTVGAAVRREQMRNNDELVSFYMELAYLDREAELYLAGSEARIRGRDKEIEDLQIEAANAESF